MPKIARLLLTDDCANRPICTVIVVPSAHLFFLQQLNYRLSHHKCIIKQITIKYSFTNPWAALCIPCVDPFCLDALVEQRAVLDRIMRLCRRRSQCLSSEYGSNTSRMKAVAYYEFLTEIGDSNKAIAC
jgi:hypothetical protein